MTTAQETLTRHGIKLESYVPGRYYTTCPKCSHTRSAPHRKLKVLGITIGDDGSVCWGCNHCAYSGPEKGSGERRELTSYIYRDAGGTPRFRKVRNRPGREPRFWLERADGRGGWVKGTKGVDTSIIYHANEVKKTIDDAQVICAVEGEKDADSLRALGIVATCNAHGASEPGKRPKWTKAHSEQLAGADIVVLNDNDAAGYEHADATCKLSLGVAKRVRRLDLKPHWPEIPKGGDVSDWLVAGHGGDELRALIASAPDYQPRAQQESACSEAAGNGGAIDDAAEIEKLARMPAIEYDRERKAAGKRLGLSRRSLLDTLVKAKRAELGLNKADGKAGHAIEFATPAPWPHTVAGAALLDGLSTVIGEYVITEQRYCDAAALWIVHTYLLDHFQVTPRIAIRSPVKRCGKSTLLRVLGCLAFKPLPTSSVTASVTFRVIEKHRPCLLIDEADMLLRSKDENKKDLYSVLLDGHARGGQSLRNVGVGDDYEPRAFNNFSAVAIASIGKLLDTLTDRSIVIELKRRKRSEQVKRRFRFDRVEHLTEMARQVMRWAVDNAERVAAVEPNMPASIFDRAADNWRPLLAIADAAAGKWPQRARTAAVEICGFDDEDEEGRLELLLGDIRDVFDKSGEDRISSAHLIEQLCEIVPRPWAEYGKNDKEITQHQLARLLKPLGIPTQKVASGDTRVNGYFRADFEEAFERYLGAKADSPSSNSDTRTPCDEIRTSAIFSSDSSDPRVRVGKCEKPNNDGPESECPSRKGGNGDARTTSTSEPCAGSGPERSLDPTELCAYCNRPGGNLVATGDGPTHRLHRECEAPWIEERMAVEGIWRA
jgi:hypothetical protein